MAKDAVSYDAAYAEIFAHSKFAFSFCTKCFIPQMPAASSAISLNKLNL